MSALRSFGAAALALFSFLVAPPSLFAQEGQGFIVGQVVDTDSGRPLPGTRITLEGTQIGVLAGVDGRFTMSRVPTGTQTVVVSLLGYGAKTITGVVVVAGEPSQLDVGLTAAAVEVQGITVTAVQERGTVTRALEEQRTAVGVVSAITAEEISRSPDSDAAAAVRRVSGVSVQDGRYVVVRGLGERYTTTSLNGARLPSPEPERKVVPLDLFPSSLLQTITTSKTFSPNLSGDFSGAQVNIQTRSYPVGRQFTFSVSTGFNPDVTGRSMLFPQASGQEWLATAAEDRALPGEVARFGNFQSEVPSQSEINRMVGSFRNVWSVGQQTGRPSGSFSASVGGSDPVLFGRTLGYLLSGTYSYGEELRLDQRRAQALPGSDGGTDEIDRFEGTSGGRTVLWGGLANLQTLLGTHSKIALNTTYNRTADDEARFETGFSENLGQEFQIQRMRYVERSVFSSQLAGEHQIGPQHKIKWSGTFSGVRRSEPDRSEFVMQIEPGQSPAWFSVSNEGAVRTFGDLEENGFEGNLSYALSFGAPGRQHTLEFGGLASRRERDASNLAYAISANLDGPSRQLAPEEIFDGRFHENGQAVFRITPVSQGGSYAAEDRLFAGYAMLDWGLTEVLRVVGGARLERSLLDLEATSTIGRPTRSTPEYTDVLPALSVTWKLSDTQNLRLSGSQTLSRPEYRELANVQFREVLGGDNVIGNPDLRRTLVRNVDLRWEWYPSANEAISVALFGKDFVDPIERIFLGTSGTRIVTFANAEGARNYGIEIEARRGLGSIADVLEPFSIFSNVTLMESEIEIGAGTQGASKTADSRPMVGQSPYVVNTGLTYANGPTSATILYNVSGKRISSAAELPLPDVYELPRHVLDLSLRFPLPLGLSGKAEFKNILDAPYEFVQGDVVREFYRSGRSVSVGASWTR
jgi:outer membrane receptor protein involved in Fe transport